MVKNVVKKMHGLNTVQTLEISDNTPLVNGYTAGSAITADYCHISPGSSFSLVTHIPQLEMETNENDRQVYIKRGFATIYFTNQSPQNIYFQTLTLRARNDIPNDYGTGTGHTMERTTLVSMMETGPGTATVQDPYLSCTFGNFFQKNFKILKNKVKQVRPGKTWSVAASFKPSNKPLTPQMLDQTRAVFRRGTIIKFFRVWGIPYFDPNESFHSVTPYIVSSVTKYYYSYYLMDDVIPSKASSTFLTITRPSIASDVRLPAITHGENIGTYQYIQHVLVDNIANGPGSSTGAVRTVLAT